AIAAKAAIMAIEIPILFVFFIRPLQALLIPFIEFVSSTFDGTPLGVQKKGARFYSWDWVRATDGGDGWLNLRHRDRTPPLLTQSGLFKRTKPMKRLLRLTAGCGLLPVLLVSSLCVSAFAQGNGTNPRLVISSASVNYATGVLSV